MWSQLRNGRVTNQFLRPKFSISFDDTCGDKKATKKALLATSKNKKSKTCKTKHLHRECGKFEPITIEMTFEKSLKDRDI